MVRQNNTTDFLAAFAVGTVLGIGATLLLKNEPRSAKERLMRELKPYRKKMRRSAGQVSRGLRRGRAATGEVADDAIDAGRELMAEFRDEMRRMVAQARDELSATLEEHRAGGGRDEAGQGEGKREPKARGRGARRSTRNTGEG